MLFDSVCTFTSRHRFQDNNSSSHFFSACLSLAVFAEQKNVLFAFLKLHKILCLTRFTGTAVAQWLSCCATIGKVAGSISAGVSGFFIDIKSS